MINYTKFFLLTILVTVCGVTIAETPIEDNEYVIFYHHDVLGSPIAVSDGKGRVLWYENTGPYGEGHGRNSSDGITSVGNPIVESADNRMGYAGHEKDNNSGLTYMKARHYDPIIGRFYSNDPVGLQANNPPSFNRYSYANGSPYRYVDPDGREVEFAETAGDETKAAWEELKNEDKSKQVIETLEKSEEVYTIASNPEAAPSFWERLFGSRDNRHGQYDPATRTIYITPGVQVEVLDLDAPGFLRPKRTISHTGVLFHEAGHAFIHDQLGIGDGSDGGPRQSERETHRIFDNPYNGFRRSGSGKFVFP